MLDADSVISLQQEQAGTAVELAKGGVVPYGENALIPKSWFNDPFAMLDQMGMGYRNAPSTITFETFRLMAEKNVIIASIIQTRLNQCAAHAQRQPNKYSIGCVVRHKDKKRKLTESDRNHIREMEDFVLNMGVSRDPERDSLDLWIRKVLRDRLQYDQLCSEKILRRNGKPHSVWAMDASTIRLAAPRTKRGSPMTPYEQQTLPKYVQIVDGGIVNEYRRNEFIFRVANPRTDLRSNGYGFSELEMLINTVTAHLWAEEWNRKVFSQGSTIKGMLNITGNIPPAQFEAFRRQWLTQVSGVSNAWKTPVLNSEQVQWIPLQPSNNDMGYQQWLEYLIKVACAVYLIDPAEINFDTRGGVGSQPMFMTGNEAQQKISKDRGLQPLLRFAQTVINEDILWDIDDDYEFAFVGLDARSESEAIDLRMKELQSYKTLNEVRAEDDLAPVEDGDIVMNPTFVGYKQQKAMAAQGGAGAPGGMPGGSPDPNAAQGGAQEPQQPDPYQNLFGEPGRPKPFGGAERAAGAAVQQHALPAGKSDEPLSGEEGTSQEESEDSWEQTIHASFWGKIDNELKKALSAFDGL